MLPINTILHPTDFSQRSDDAFRLACSLAQDHGARLIILHVREVPATVYGEFGQLPVEQEGDAALRERLGHVLPAQTRLRVEHFLWSGDPATEIIRIAERTPCDLIVMGTHGRTGFGRLLMGSVAERVMRKAPCPVLTVKAPFRKTCELTAITADRADACNKISTEAPDLVEESIELGVGD